jgi:hypothetical protein
MDTQDNKTPEEELQHLKEVKQPEDFEHPEPDIEQPEAKEPPHGLHRVLPVAVAMVGALVAFLVLSAK